MTTPGLRGTTTVSDRAVRRIAERAATEAVPGPGTGAAKGSAHVHGRRADVGVDVTLPYPAPLPEAVRRVQHHVTARTSRLTGLDVTRARVGVTGLVPEPVPAPAPAPARTVSPDASPDGPPEGRAQTSTDSRTPLRWWSQRRVPIMLLSLAAAVACGALAVDMLLVHAARRPAAAWRTGTLDWLSRHGPGDATVMASAGAVAVLGVLMIVLALVPGHRELLTVTAPGVRLRAALDRTAVAALVADAVGGTRGIGPVRVRVRRRRVTVRAGLAFGDRELVLDEVRRAAHRALEDCRLRRLPRLRVRVRPEAAWDPGADARTGGDAGAGTGSGAGAGETAFEEARH
ncbi:DUF6286 domain-containing Asp23/Gls24 family envelope stress response protein [Streptomyces beigongshangae]|uniref:DUF6286 domain-containing Asp23/Gls24 family envelope stress response protein n=1 Tax=Streptomyces beigongshangae TaxID=2841597 RepID=UPI0021A6B042|nr:DUF6286 domain-containing Asp23/Gls24 family envelope stress response protein [Streptomyces sp. REN17]